MYVFLCNLLHVFTWLVYRHFDEGYTKGFTIQHVVSMPPELNTAQFKTTQDLP